MSDNEAPTELTLIQSKTEFNKKIQIEKQHQKRHQNNAKKRKPRWTKSNLNKTKLNEAEFNENDFVSNSIDEPQSKKRRLNKWMQESDLFHHIKATKNEKNENNENDDDEIVNEKNEIEINDDNDKVPFEVIELFEKAIRESKTEKEIQDQWKKIIDEQSKKYKNLKHKISAFDKIFVDGFQIEVNGVNRINLSGLKRALRMKHFSMKKHRRIDFNQKMSVGTKKPSITFTQKIDYNKNMTLKPKSFWGHKIAKINEMSTNDLQSIDKWLKL